MIKTIIFDLGDVIVNVDRTEQYNRFAINCDQTVDYIKKYFENFPWGDAFSRGKLSPYQFYCKTAKELNLKMDFEKFKKVWCDIFTLNQDVEKLIKKLRRKHKLVLLSNTDAIHFGHIKKQYSIINAFDEDILSYEVGLRKPNPLIFLHALTKAKTLPFNCAYIDDVPRFVYVAKAMGIKAFQYKNFKKLVEDLSNSGVLSKNL